MSSDDDADEAQFVSFVREHISSRLTARASSSTKEKDDSRRRTSNGPDDFIDEASSIPSTPRRVEAEAVMHAARESARKAREQSRASASKQRADESAHRRNASAVKLALAVRRTNGSEDGGVERQLDMESDRGMQSEDDLRTPVRVGSFRSRKVVHEGFAREASGRRASLTPPRGQLMSVVSPVHERSLVGKTVTDASTSEMEVETTTTTTTTMMAMTTGERQLGHLSRGGTKQDLMNVRAVETEIERLRAKVAALTRELDIISVEKQTWQNERVRMSALMTAAEEDLKTTESRMSKTESRLAAAMNERENALIEADRLRESLERTRREFEEMNERSLGEHTSTISRMELSIREYQLKIERLETSLVETETKIRTDEVAMKKVEEELATTKLDLHSAQSHVASLKDVEGIMGTEAERIRSEIVQLNQALKERDTKFAEATDRFKKLETENEGLMEDIARLNETIALTNSTMRQKDEAIDSAHADAECARAERSEALDELRKLHSTLTAKDADLESEKRAKEELTATLEETRAALTSKTAEKRAFEMEMADLKVEISTLRTRLEKEAKRAMTSEERIESAKEAFAARLAAASEKQASFQGRLLEMKSSVESEKKKIEEEARIEIESLTAELKDLQRQLAEKDGAYKSASKNSAHFEKKLEITAEQLSQAKSDLMQLKAKVNEGDLRRVELEHSKEELRESLEKIKLMETERSELLLHLKSARKDVSMLQGKVAGLETAADLAAADRDTLLERLHAVEQEVESMTEENELTSSMAAQANMTANAKVSKLEKQLAALNKEIDILRDQHDTNAEEIKRRENTSNEAFIELQKKMEVADRRVKELTSEVNECKKNSEMDKRKLQESERRVQDETNSREALELELEDLRQKYQSAESRVYELNTEILLVNKELEREKINSTRHAKTDAGGMKGMKSSRDEALTKVNHLTADLAKVTAERDLLQQSITSMDKRLDFERQAFATQVKEAVKDATKSKENENVVLRRELDAVPLDDKNHELALARESVSELKANVTRLTHQLEHANELLATAQREASMSQQDEQDELRIARKERDESKRALEEVEARLASALAEKEWFEKHNEATEAELKASKAAAAAATKMSEQARTQLARYKHLSPKALLSPTKHRGFGSPMISGQLASPLKWFSRQTERTPEVRTPPNNLFNKFSMATPTVPTRTPGGSWRVPSRPESLGEALQTLMFIGAFIFILLVFLAVTPMIAQREALRRSSITPPRYSHGCGIMFRVNDAVLEFAHGLLGMSYRSMCAQQPPS
ncbi:unnamed product [Ostreococcus tauri]|uniref:Unnamed product n=1 Tax=Ostreococcus tauri TaxID=70448 RepID=A0A096PAQ6_OSTTA|nr:unnamed product [Ostreococcus tauri]CEG02068.1 unnamed product [Ostreococcus tauri]|eukprot:XP_022841330.1 unnamed product [Ostreococcus tauri]